MPEQSRIVLPKVAAPEETLRPIILANVLSLENNIIGVPLAVLNSRAASSSRSISYEWEAAGVFSSYQLERPDYCPLPQLEHAEYLLTAVAMFAQRPNTGGGLAFRINDIAHNAGRADSGGSTHQSIKEMVWRYTRCQVRWHQAWKVRGEEQRKTWHGPLIISEDLFEAGEHRALRRNPGNSRLAKDWHHIIFHPMLIESLKSNFFRIFLTEVMQSDLSNAAKCVYRYFFGFGDTTIVYRTFDTLMSAFPWRSGKKRFIAWLTSQLNELSRYGVLSGFDVNDWGVSVQCVPIKTLQAKAKSAGTPPTFTNDGLTDQELIDEFPRLRAAGLLRDSVAEGVNAFVLAGQLKVAAQTLRRHLAKTLQP